MQRRRLGTPHRQVYLLGVASWRRARPFHQPRPRRVDPIPHNPLSPIILCARFMALLAKACRPAHPNHAKPRPAPLRRTQHCAALACRCSCCCLPGLGGGCFWLHTLSHGAWQLQGSCAPYQGGAACAPVAPSSAAPAAGPASSSAPRAAAGGASGARGARCRSAPPAQAPPPKSELRSGVRARHPSGGALHASLVYTRAVMSWA